VFQAYIGKRAWKSIGDTIKGQCYLSSHDHDHKIRIKEQRRDIGKCCFEIRTTKIWKQLPAEAVAAFSFKIHKMRKSVRKLIMNEER
jgi:hypothetical protein